MAEQAKDNDHLHDQLWQATTKLPLDYEPYGQVGRNGCCDCSCGCRYFVPLEGKLGFDWGVCINRASHRCGLLTSEHMGCPQFQPEREHGEEGGIVARIPVCRDVVCYRGS